MGSGNNSTAQGKYVGVGAGGNGFVEVTLGFKPKVLKIRSVQAEVVLHQSMPGAWKQLDSGVPAFLNDGDVLLTEFGFKVTGNIVGINTSAVEYFYEAY